MRRAASRLLKQFSFQRPRKGQLVLTAEIGRVVRIEKTYRTTSGYNGWILVIAPIFPECEECKRFYRTKRGQLLKKAQKNECCHHRMMHYGKQRAGQQSVMVLKSEIKKNRRS